MAAAFHMSGTLAWDARASSKIIQPIYSENLNSSPTIILMREKIQLKALKPFLGKVQFLVYLILAIGKALRAIAILIAAKGTWTPSRERILVHTSNRLEFLIS